MKNISENSINFDLRDIVFLSFQDKINIENDFKTYLKSLKKDDLKTIIRYMALFENCDELVVIYNGFNKYTKKDIYEYILNNQGFIIESFIKNLAIDSFKSLKIIIELLDKNGYYRFNYKEFIPFNKIILNNLSDTKLAYIKTEGIYTEIHIPKDNIKIMKEVLKYKDTLPIVELNEEVLKRTYGLTNVYGAVKIEDIPKLDSYFKETDTEELETLFKRLLALNMSYKMTWYNGKYIIYSPEIRTENEVKKILETDMDYKIYSRDIFDKFCNETYVETLKPYKELIKELKSINYSSENIKYIKDYVINDYLAMHHLDEEGAKNFFWKSVQSFSNDRMFNNLLYEKVIKIADKWPKWLLKGDIKNNETIKVEKIGRNEPCPCGSGKKYKKCCSK